MTAFNPRRALLGASFVALCTVACGARSTLSESGTSGAGSATATGRDESSGGGGATGGSGGITTAAGTGGTAGAGGESCQDAILATDASGANVLALDGDTVLWASIAGAVQSSEHGVSTTLAQIDSPAGGIAFDEERVYIVTGSGQVRSVARSGGPLENIADEVGKLFTVHASPSALYVTDLGQSPLEGRVLRVGYDGAVVVLAEGLWLGGRLVADDDNLYVPVNQALTLGAKSAAILCVPKNGDPVTVLLSIDTDAQLLGGTLALRGDGLYFYTNDGESKLGWVSLAGGSATDLGPLPLGSYPLAMTVDAQFAYVSAFDSSQGGKLFRVSLAGNDTTALEDSSDLFSSLASNNEAVFFTLSSFGTEFKGPASVRKRCK